MTDVTLQSEPALPPARSFGRRVRSTAGYVFLVALMLIASPLAVFLPAALLHCGIRNGKRAAWIVLLLAAVIGMLLILPASLAPQTPPPGAINSAVAYQLGLVLTIGLPALLMLPLVERGERFGRVLLFALLLGVLGMFATEWIMQATASFSPYAEQIAAARDTATKLVDTYRKAGVPEDAIRFLRKWMNVGVFVLPAFLLIDVAVVFILSMVLFGRLPAWRQFVARRGLPAATPYLFRNLALPEWLLFAFVIGGLSPMLSGMPQRIGANILAVVTFLYLVQGLAIFRSFIAATGGAFALFAWGTLGLLTITGIGPLLLSIAGLFDSFFDFRHFNRKDHSDESHSH